MTRLLPAALLLLLTACTSNTPDPPAQPAEPVVLLPCAEHGQALEWFAQERGQKPIARGLTNEGAMIEILRSAEGWSMLITVAPDQTCFIAAGPYWEDVLQPKGTAL